MNDFDAIRALLNEIFQLHLEFFGNADLASALTWLALDAVLARQPSSALAGQTYRSALAS